MNYYQNLKQALVKQGLNPHRVMVVDHHVMGQCKISKKWCIFHFSKGFASDFKYYNNYKEPSDIMLNFMRL